MLDDYTVLDLETTSTDALTGRITEVAARRYRNGWLAAAWSALVWAGQEPEAGAVLLNGLTGERLAAEGLSEVEAMRAVLYLLGDSLLVAHNAAFELAWLHQTCLRLFAAPFSNPFLCTCTLARALGAGSGHSYSLRQLTSDYGIELVNAHRAMPDVVATKSLLDLLLYKHRFEGHRAELLAELRNCCELKKDKGHTLPEGLPEHVNTLFQ